MITTQQAQAKLGPRHAPGILVIGNIQPGIAAAIRIVRHSGATITRSLEGRVNLQFVGTASSRWAGWYSSAIVANGWQPYDQPDVAAYVPFGWDGLVKQGLHDGGVVFRQPGTDRLTKLTLLEESLLAVCAVESLEESLAELLLRTGVSELRQPLVRLLRTATVSSDVDAA